MTNKNPVRKIGVISDTHGLLRPEALAALEGVDLILHAGDVGNEEVLERLSRIARVVAVRGNMDRKGRVSDLPPTEMVEAGGKTFFLVHDLLELDLDPNAAEIHAVIVGHSHRPKISQDNGVLFLNPGSAGPRRFDLPVTVAILEIEGKALKPRMIELQVE